MVRKKQVASVNNDDEKRAYNVCLLEPTNMTLIEISNQAGNIINLLKKTKSKEEFQKTIQILTKLSESQLFLATTLADITKSMQDKPEEKVEEKPKVH